MKVYDRQWSATFGLDDAAAAAALAVFPDARRRVGDRPVLCTLQLALLYTEGVHAGTDLLADAAAGGRKRDVVRGLRCG